MGVKEAFFRLHGCKTLFLFYPNIIALGPDSFVLVDSPEDPKKVFKIYTNTTLEKILKYKGETEKFAQQNDGKTINCEGKEFLLKVQPILDIKLLKNDCVVTLCPFVAGKNEHDRYMGQLKAYSEKNPKDPYLRGACIQSYESGLKNALDFYIDPRNFKVDEEKNIITITDIKSNVTRGS